MATLEEAKKKLRDFFCECGRPCGIPVDGNRNIVWRNGSQPLVVEEPRSIHLNLLTDGHIRFYVYGEVADIRQQFNDLLHKKGLELEGCLGGPNVVAIYPRTTKSPAHALDVVTKLQWKNLELDTTDEIKNQAFAVFKKLYELLKEADVFNGSGSRRKLAARTHALKKVVLTHEEEDHEQEDVQVTQAARVEASDETVCVTPNGKVSQYWQKYYDFWDDFVSTWFEEMQHRNNSLAQCRNPYGDTKHISRVYARMVNGLNFDELPEPYLGKPHEGVEAVFLNLNPGMSMLGLYGAYRGLDLEATKFFSNLNNDTGWLIKKFVKAGSYRKFIDDWSCLIPELRDHEPEVCGVDWWQGIDCDRIVDVGPRNGRQIRMKWVRQIYGNPVMSSLKVFAPELCPYHSLTFNANETLGDRQLVAFMWEHVMEPALMAVKENKNVPFVIAVGMDYCNLLEQFGGRKEQEWSLGKMVNEWPGRTQRWYRLYAVNLDGHHEVRVLVTWGGRNKTPGDSFKGVDGLIRQYCLGK